MVEALKAEGLSLRAIAARLTAAGVETVRGGAWSAMQVSNVLKRLEA
jgi:Recombinase